MTTTIACALRKDNIQEFRRFVPMDYVCNLDFRRQLYAQIAKSKEVSALVFNFLKEDPELFFDIFCLTYNPRHNPPQIPFILRPKQREVVRALTAALDKGGTIVVDKSRDEGATEICTKLLTYYWLTRPNFYALIASHKEELVDKSNDYVIEDLGPKGLNRRITGSFRTLFYKILEPLVHIPLAWVPPLKKSYLMLENLQHKSVIQGESTNPDLGVGGRYSLVFIDELCRVEPSLAATILQNLPDTSKTIWYNSSLGVWGNQHPYIDLMFKIRSGSIAGEVVTLDWTDNPEKRKGLYISPAPGMIQILDEEYWKPFFPPKLWKLVKGQIIDLSKCPPDIKQIYNWVADGGEGTFGRPRSIWLDAEERRRGNKVDLAMNVLRIAPESVTAFYDPVLIADLRKQAKPPIKKCFVAIGCNDRGAPFVELMEDERRGQLRLWEDLPFNNHRLAFGVDVSFGTGNSNSVIAILDRETGTVVGLFASANHDPYKLAEVVTGLSNMIYAKQQESGRAFYPLIIFENIGPGTVFLKRLLELKCRNIYRRRMVESGDQMLSYGIVPTSGPRSARYLMLTELEMLLKAGLGKEKGRKLFLYDIDAINEMEHFSWGRGYNIKIEEVDTSTATTHGDLVMAIAMAAWSMSAAAEIKDQKLSPMQQWIRHCESRLGPKKDGKFLTVEDL